MEKIFLTVLNMSLTASFVIIAIILARLMLKKSPKIISYTLWAVAGFRLVFPYSLESVFSLLPFKAAPIPQDIVIQAVPRIDSGIVIIDNAISASLPVAASYASVNPLQIWILIAYYIWLIGAALMLVYSFISIMLLKNKLRSAVHIEKNLYEADNIKTPFVIGLFSPKIYIPTELSGDECHYIILHEQIHIRRHDHVIKMFAYIILCLHWFNPLVWIAFVLMSADMEMSCDERVMRELGKDIKNAYSLSLVRMASGRKILNGSPLAFGEGGMKKRIKNILNFRKPSRIIIVTSVALAAALSVGFAVNKSAEKQQTEDDTAITGTTYSPDGKFIIEGYGVDYSTEVSGLNPVKQFRIVEVSNGNTVWSMDGSLINTLSPFDWSADGRYVYIAYLGRQWKDGLVVDTSDMSEQSLPGITLLAPLFPDTTPDDNRPDPYIEPSMWLEDNKLLVTFSWRVKEDVSNEENRIYGEYLYDVSTGEFTLRSVEDELNDTANVPDITTITSLTLDENGVNDDAIQLIQHIPEGKIFAELVEVVATLGDGRILSKSYEGFWFTKAYTADLLNNGQQIIVLNLYYFGSNYSAMDCHVLSVIDGELLEILTVLDAALDDALALEKYQQSIFEIPLPNDNFGLGEDGRTSVCTDSSIVDIGGRAALKIQHLMREVTPYTVLMWDGLAWSVAEQGIDRYESSILQKDFTGEWHRTNTVKSFYGTVTIENQTDESFDFSFYGMYGANSGMINGTAVITADNKAIFNHIPDYDKTIFAQVTFALEGDNLQVNLTDGRESALGFGHNVSIDGEYTKSEPIYLDEGIVDEILPTIEIKEKMQSLLGNDVYEQVLSVFEHGVRFQVDDLTYTGFISGAGQGVDLLIKDDKIYCLCYGLDADGLIYKLYTNDKDYQDKLPPFLQIERPDYVLQFVYKPL